MNLGQSNKSAVLIFAYFLGAVLYGVHLGWTWFAEGIIPDRPLWIHLLAPVAAVVFWLVVEVIGIYVGNGFTFDERKRSKWRRAVGLIGLFVLLTVVIIGIPFYQMSKGS